MLSERSHATHPQPAATHALLDNKVSIRTGGRTRDQRLRVLGVRVGATDVEAGNLPCSGLGWRLQARHRSRFPERRLIRAPSSGDQRMSLTRSPWGTGTACAAVAYAFSLMELVPPSRTGGSRHALSSSFSSTNAISRENLTWHSSHQLCCSERLDGRRLGDATIPPGMNTTTIRTAWNGVPLELETLWTLSKGSRCARLVMYTHQLGWELRVQSGALLMTQVCRSDQEIEDVSAEWRAAMVEKGWA